jgi:serine/threonine protein kinase
MTRNKIEWFDYLAGLDQSQRALELEELRVLDVAMAEELTRLLGQDDLLRQNDVEQRKATLDAVLDEGKIAQKAIAHLSPMQPRINGYHIMEWIAHGGMGEVWKASRQLANESQIVAIKLLRLDEVGGAAHQRFLQEQKTLLKFAHPNIARLLDAGIAQDGRPWIAMEYIQGAPISVFCDQQKLDLRARLHLFRQVLVAVQYAHDFLIVHRDLKPDNVLVDQSGQVKLLDFGIAKSLEHEGLATATQQRYFSLYATAPEQWLGEAVGVGTDVYALGGLLYELLSGQELMADAGKLPGQLEQFIVRKTPTLPSRKVTKQAANNRGFAESAQQIKALSGELDRIVLHALRKRIDERYESVRAFDADIEAFLQQRPVRAVGQSTRYRLQKFVQRHWLASSLTAAAVLSLVGLTIMLAWRSQQLQLANTAAKAAQTRAEDSLVKAQEAQKAAESVNQFLMDVFKRADPLAEEKGDKSLSVMVDASLAEIKEQQRFDQANAPLLLALARGLIAIGKLDRAAPLLNEMEQKIQLSAEQQLELNLSLAEVFAFERDHKALRERLNQVTSVAKNVSLTEDEKHKLLDLQVKLAGMLKNSELVLKLTDSNSLSVSSFQYRMNALSSSKRFAEAERLAQARLNSPGIKPIDRLAVHLALVNLADFSGDRKRRLIESERALSLGKTIYGAGHSRVLGYANDYALALLRVGKFKEAKTEFNKILVAAQEVFRADDPRFRYLSFNLALCAASEGNANDADQRRLEKAAEGPISRHAITARLALARDSYLKGRIQMFADHLSKLDGIEDPGFITAELLFWRWVMRGDFSKDAESTNFKALADFDPVVQSLLIAREPQK